MGLSALAPNLVHDVWPWAALLLLGAAHGINPGMGWLFAVGLGMQRQERGAVWRALLPLAAGHLAAIAVVAVVVGVAGLAVSLGWLRWIVAGVLLTLGVWKLVRTSHPRYGGMSVGSREVAVWSFLMASAHGAGLMVVPFLMRVVRPAALGGGTGRRGPLLPHGRHRVSAGSHERERTDRGTVRLPAVRGAVAGAGATGDAALRR